MNNLHRKGIEFDTFYIYSLRDPLSKEIRYIGKTNNLVRRLNSHLAITESYQDSKIKAEWLLRLKSLKVKPIIEIIEECTYNNVFERETYHIRQAIVNGVKLVNSNAQIIDLSKTTGLNIIVQNKVLFIFEEMAKSKKTTRECFN